MAKEKTKAELEEELAKAVADLDRKTKYARQLETQIQNLKKNGVGTTQSKTVQH